MEYMTSGTGLMTEPGMTPSAYFLSLF